MFGFEYWNGPRFVIIGLFCAAALAAQSASPPPEGQRFIRDLDRNTPEWLSLGVTYRVRAEGRRGNGFKEGNDDAYGLGRLLVDIGVKPSSWLRFHFQGQDSRAPGKQNAGPVFRDPFDVRQGWVEIGDPERGWVRLRAGRQELNFGAQRLVGPLDWTNTARQFDAAKLTFGKKDLNVDLFASSLVELDPDGFNRSGRGQDLHGAYGNLNRLVGKGALEPFMLWKVNLRDVTEAGSIGRADIYTGGFRFVRPLPGNFDFQAEFARQFGSVLTDDISAWGAYGVLGHTLKQVAWTPRVSIEYQYGSGDPNPNDGKRQTFDQLYPTGHLYQGTADRIGWRNVKDVRGGVDFKPHPKFSFKIDYFSFWLANRNDHLYAVNGKIAVPAPAGGARNSHVGREIDAILTWKPAGHIALGAGVGHFFPGKFLKQTTPGAGHTFPFVFLNYVM